MRRKAVDTLNHPRPSPRLAFDPTPQVITPRKNTNNRFTVVIYDRGPRVRMAPTLEDAKQLVEEVKLTIEGADIFSGDELVYSWGILPHAS